MVVVGAGFGGLAAVRALRHAPVAVTVLDRQNHHTFQPLLYQVATAALNASDIAAPIRRVLRRQKNAHVLMEEITAVDTARRKVVCEDGELGYDSLILAAGATHAYFGHEDWAPLAPGLKTLGDALEIRTRVLSAFEAAEREDDPVRRQEWITFVVVGAGPTGIELAGALSEIARETLVHDFRRVDPRRARVLLLEASPRVLPLMVPEISAMAERQLEHICVEVRTGVPVTAIDEEGVWLGRDRVRARTVLWAAGVAASPLGRTLGVPVDRAGRVLVEADLTLPGHPEVYVIGDLASLAVDGKRVPGLAPAAIQEGRHAALNVQRTLAGQPRLPFHYEDRGTLATIGRAAAVADFGRFKIGGLFAWLAWLFVHIFFLIGFRNRFFVMLEWVWSYVTFDRGARVILGARTGAAPLPAVKQVPATIAPPREGAPAPTAHPPS